MGQAKDRGPYEVRVAKARERNVKLTEHIEAGRNDKAKRALRTLGPQRLAVGLVMAGALYEKTGPRGT